jgi:hypothetical protein
MPQPLYISMRISLFTTASARSGGTIPDQRQCHCRLQCTDIEAGIGRVEKKKKWTMDEQASIAAKTQLMEMTTDIVSSFLSKNKMTVADLSVLI